MYSPEQTKEPDYRGSNFLFKNSYSNDHSKFVAAWDFLEGWLWNVVTILRLKHSKVVPAGDSLEDWHTLFEYYTWYPYFRLTDSVETTLQWLSFSDSFSDDLRRLSFWARSCCTLPCKWRNNLAVLVSSPGLGLGVVELRLVPTPLSVGDEWPFTMGLPTGVCVNKSRYHG